MSFELSGAARAGERAAIAKRHLTDIERIDAERSNDAQIVSAVKTLTSGKTRVALADKAIRLAGENLKAARANFFAGRGTNFEVMQRQQQVLESELRRGKAVADYRTAVVKLQFLSGTLLEAYRIHVRGADSLPEAERGAASDRPAPRATRSKRERGERTARAGEE